MRGKLCFWGEKKAASGEKISQSLLGRGKEVDLSGVHRVIGYAVLIRKSVYMSVLLCTPGKIMFFPSLSPLPYTKVAPSLSGVARGVQWAICTPQA